MTTPFTAPLTEDFWSFMCRKSEEFFPQTPVGSRPQSGFVICGYPRSEFFPEEYMVDVPTLEPQRLRPPINGEPDFGVNWYGMTDAIERFHHGRDPGLFGVLGNLGLTAQQASDANTAVEGFQYPVLFQAMPLGDAIDYAEFLVRMTINRYRFCVGAEICGGAVDIATITRKDGFSWTRRKRRGTDAE